MNNARSCAIRCADVLFRTFLREELQIPGVKDGLTGEEAWLKVQHQEAAAQACRYLMGIQSRRELDTPEGAPRWERLAGRFELWKRDLL